MKTQEWKRAEQWVREREVANPVPTQDPEARRKTILLLEVMCMITEHGMGWRALAPPSVVAEVEETERGSRCPVELVWLEIARAARQGGTN